MQKEVEVMQVFRTPPRGNLAIEVRKQRYNQLADIKEENIRQFVLAAIGELIDFAGGYKTLVDAGLAPPPVIPSPPATGPLEGEALTLEQERFLANLEAQKEAVKQAASKTKPAFTMAGTTPRIEPTPGSTADKSNIVAQIDALVQKHVEADASLAGRSIHLRANPTGGLRIEIDGRYYQKPKDVEDPVIQQLIKRALKEWESI